KVQRHYAERFVRMLPHVIQNGIDDDRGFAWIPAAFEDAIRDEMMLYSQRWVVVISRRENNKVSLIELFIRKCDEAVMPRSVMPPQPPNGLEQCAGHIENTFAFLDRCTSLVSGIVFRVKRHALEEASGRKLLRITDDYNLPASGQRTDGILRPELRGLIHHDKIEFELAGGEILCDGQRPHHK